MKRKTVKSIKHILGVFIALFLTLSSRTGIIRAASHQLDIDNLTIADLIGIFIRILGIFSIALPAAAVLILFLWSSFLYITSGGDPTKLEKAQKTATYAVLGFLIVIFASSIIAVLSNLIGTEINIIPDFLQ